MKFKNQLKGERLVLKRTKPDLKMAKTIFKKVDEEREHLDPWFPWPNATRKIEDTLKYLFDKEEETKKGKKVEYGIFFKNEYIGNIAIFDIDEKHKSAEVGYWLSSSHTRKGYMTEALRILERDAFERMKLNRVELWCDEENQASIGVAKKCGYQYEGKLRECSYNDHLKAFRDMLVFSKLKSEYEKKS